MEKTISYWSLHRTWVKNILAAAFIFTLAFGVRILHFNYTQAKQPLVKDQIKYFNTAFNLRFHNAHSLEYPKSEPPKTRTDLPGGYPLFLSFFFHFGSEISDFIKRVITIQIILSSLSAALTFLIARESLSIPWSLTSAILTAFSPHLIVMTNFILTETLFIFVMNIGILFLTHGFKRENPFLVFVGGIALSFIAQIRTIGALLLPLLALVFVFRPGGRPLLRRSKDKLSLLFIIISILAGVTIHHSFIATKVLNTPGAQHPTPHYVKLAGPKEFIKHAVKPPEFILKDQSYILNKNKNPSWKKQTSEKSKGRPADYVKWNLLYKPYCIWAFNNAYTGDVYVYSMKNKGFENNFLLKIVHRLMYLAHWPLFVLSLSSTVMLLTKHIKGTISKKEEALLIPTTVFLYFWTVIYMVSWLPRYSIPARPVSYILASAFLAQITRVITEATKRKKIQFGSELSDIPQSSYKRCRVK